jgi:hypothetical protein
VERAIGLFGAVRIAVLALDLLDQCGQFCQTFLGDRGRRQAAASPSNNRRASVSSKAEMLKPGCPPCRAGA